MPRCPFVSLRLSAAVALCLLPGPTDRAWAQGASAQDKPPQRESADHDHPDTPKVGQEAHDFTLPAVVGDPVTLSELTAQGPVVMLVLRGYPGYQCPICTRQVAGFLRRAEAFKDRGATVLMIYPGPADGLKTKAQQFVGDAELPEHFRFVIDPGYRFTNQYGLRWDAPNETAYPSTFIIDRGREVVFSHISHTHGNRTDAPTILDRLADHAD